MTHFDESEHPRAGDGRFAIKPVAEADIDSLIVHGEPAVERIQNTLRDAVSRGQLDGQAWIDCDDDGRPSVTFTDDTDTEWAVHAGDDMIHVGILGDEERFTASDYHSGGWEQTVRELPAVVAKAQTRRADHLAFTRLAQQYADLATGPLRDFTVDGRLAQLVVGDTRPQSRASLREFQSADPEHDRRPTARLHIGGFEGPDSSDYLIVAGPASDPDETRVYQDDRELPLPGWQADAVLTEASRRFGGELPTLVPHLLDHAATKSRETGQGVPA